MNSTDNSKLSPLAQKVAAMSAKAASRKPEKVEAKQLDLFVADLLDYSLKDDISSMEAPLFSLSTKPDMAIWRWTSADGAKWLEVVPSVIGRATMHDKDLLIYLSSQLMASMNEATRNGTKMPSRKIKMTPHDYFLATGKGVDGRTYKNFEATLDRLAGTRLKTNIAIGNIERRSGFGLLQSFDLDVYTDGSGEKHLSGIEVVLSEWLYQALEQKNVLTISDSYFTLRKPLEKRLYEIARKHVGKQTDWVIDEENLREKTGSAASKAEFRRMLSAIISDGSIPDYKLLQMKNSANKNVVKFSKKAGT